MVCVDIETSAVEDVGEYLELGDIKVPSNYKDPEKIEFYKASKLAEKIDKAAVEPDLCRIVAIGAQSSTSDIPFVQTAPDETSERAMIASWWDYAGDQILMGYNALDFDVPVLLRRSLYLGVHAPQVEVSRFRHPRVVDLLQILSMDGKLTWRSLDWYCCRRFRLDVPEDEISGADIPGLVEAGEWVQVKDHVVADVKKTVALAIRLGVWRR